MFDKETTRLFIADLDVAYESDLREFYDPDYIAIEGFGHDFKDNVSAYMEAIQKINSAIPQAIADGDAERIREYCNKGIKLCEQFRNDLKAMPKDKFAGIRNLMPCFKVLMTIAVTAMYCGGARAIGKLPIMKPLVNAGQKLIQFGENKRGVGSIGNRAVGFAQRRTKDIVLFKFPLIHQFINAGKDMPPLSKAEKMWKGVSYAAQLYGIFKQVRGTIKQVMNEGKYAKMVRDEDKNDQNKGNRQYMAMLGQIEEMIGMFKAMAEDADNLVAGNKDAKATEGMSVYVELFGPENTLSIVMESYCESAMEAIGVSGYDAIYAKYAPILNAINERIITALSTGHMADLEKFCKQGIHTMKQMRNEVKNLPADQWGKIKNFIPCAEMLNSICGVIMAIDKTKKFKDYFFSREYFQNMTRGTVSAVSNLRKIDKYQDITDAEIKDATNSVAYAFELIRNAGRGYLNGKIVGNAFNGLIDLVSTMSSSMAQSKYGRIISVSDQDDPNIGNKKYRITLNQIDAAIDMYEYIATAKKMPDNGLQAVTESWLIDPSEKSACWLVLKEMTDMPQCWLTEDISPAEEGLFSNIKKRREEKAARKAQFDEYKANIEKRTAEILSSNPTVESLAKELAGIFIKADAEKHDDTYSAKILRGSVGKKDITDDTSGYIAEWKQEHGSANIKVCQVKDLYYGIITSGDDAFMVLYPFDGNPATYTSLKELAREIAMYTVTRTAQEGMALIDFSGCWLADGFTSVSEAFSVPKFKKGGFIDKYTDKAAANIAKSANKAAKKKYGDDFEKRINARIKEILNSGKSNEAICQESLKLMVGSKRYMHGDLGKQMAEANCGRMKKKCKVAKVCNAANLYYVYVETQDGEAAVYIPFAGGKDMERMAMRRVANEIARYEIMKNKGAKVMESFHDKVFNEGEEEPKDQSAVCGDINTVGPLIDQYVSYIKELYFTIENGQMVTHIATPAEAKVNIEAYCSYPKKDPNVSTPLMKSGTYPYTCKIEHGIVTHVVIPVPAKDFPMGVKCLPLNQVIDDLRNTIGIDQKYDVITRKRALCQVMSIFKDLLEREKYAPLRAYASDELKFENMGRVDQKDPEGWSKFLMGHHEADMGGFDFTAAKDKAQSLMDLMNMHFYPEARKAYAKSSSGDKFVLHMHSEDFKCCFDLATMEYYQEGVAPYDHFEEEFGSAQESIFDKLFGKKKSSPPQSNTELENLERDRKWAARFNAYQGKDLYMQITPLVEDILHAASASIDGSMWAKRDGWDFVDIDRNKPNAGNLLKAMGNPPEGVEDEVHQTKYGIYGIQYTAVDGTDARHAKVIRVFIPGDEHTPKNPAYKPTVIVLDPQEVAVTWDEMVGKLKGLWPEDRLKIAQYVVGIASAELKKPIYKDCPMGVVDINYLMSKEAWMHGDDTLSDWLHGERDFWFGSFDWYADGQQYTPEYEAEQFRLLDSFIDIMKSKIRSKYPRITVDYDCDKWEGEFYISF